MLPLPQSEKALMQDLTLSHLGSIDDGEDQVAVVVSSDPSVADYLRVVQAKSLNIRVVVVGDVHEHSAVAQHCYVLQQW